MVGQKLFVLRAPSMSMAKSHVFSLVYMVLIPVSE